MLSDNYRGKWRGFKPQGAWHPSDCANKIFPSERCWKGWVCLYQVFFHPCPIKTHLSHAVSATVPSGMAALDAGAATTITSLQNSHDRRVDVRRVSFWSIVIIFSIALSYKNSPLSCRTIHREEVAWSGDGGAATATDVQGFSLVHSSPSKALEGFGWIGMVGGAVDVLVAAKDNITTNLNHSVLDRSY